MVDHQIIQWPVIEYKLNIFKELQGDGGIYGVDQGGLFVQNEIRVVGYLSLIHIQRCIRDRAIDSGNLEAAFDAAHTLKGVVGNMGLTPLYKAVCDIVQPLRAREEREDYPLLYQAIQKEFLKVEELGRCV